MPVFAVILDIVRDPSEFVMAADPSSNVVRVGARIVSWTVRLLVRIPFEAVIFKLLILGTDIASEKRRSLPRYVIYFSLNEMELVICRELVV